MADIGKSSARDGALAPTAAAVVAEALVQLVLGEMSPGQSLPSEGELAERFSVSRLTLREAMKMVAGRGLLDVGRGRRAVVKEPTGAAFADFLATIIQNDPKGLFDLVELRMSLEVQSATMAARRGTRAGLSAIETAMEGMREAVKVGTGDAEQRFHQFDVAFHEAIAFASGNRLISYLFEAMETPLRRSFHLSMRGHVVRGRKIEETLVAHEAILAAIRAENPKAAAAAMRSHLEDTERDIRAALSANPSDAVTWSARDA